MTRATPFSKAPVEPFDMEAVRITLVSQDPLVREAAARAFDSAPRHWSLGLLDRPPAADEDLGRVLWGPDLDAPQGALRFDPSDPASLSGLAAPVDADAATGLFVVSSCVGGAGVSSVALHLARAFVAMRRKTLLVEPVGGEWLRTRLGLPADARTADSIDRTEDSLVLSCLPVSGGFKVLLGAPHDRLDELARRAGKAFDRVVIDLGCVDPSVSATGGVFVLPPTRPAVMTGKAALTAPGGVPWAVVCNRLGSGGSLTPALMSKELGRAVDVGLPCTPALRDAEDRCELLPLRYRWTRAVTRIAKALDEL